MRSKTQVGEDFEDSCWEEKMSKSLMKLRLHRNINQQIQKENSKVMMQLQTLKEEKQKLQDKLICHEEFHRGIFHELERKLQTKDRVLAPSTLIHEDWQVEDVKYSMQEKLTLSKGIIEKDDSSYYSFSYQDG
jgi:hypothetical protein